MITAVHSLLRALAALVLLLTVASGYSASRSTEGLQRATPLAPAHVAAVSPLGWVALENRLRRGVQRGVAPFRLESFERDEVTAIAMERALQALEVADEPIRHPEAWGKTIAQRVALDTLRSQRRDRLRLGAEPLVDAPSAAVGLDGTPDGPFEQLASAERRQLLHQRVADWPAAERRLAELLMDGEADTITAAAWLLRAEEEAAGGEGTMYPQKARLLLEARRSELSDLM